MGKGTTEMTLRLSSLLTDKIAEIVILGPSVAPDLALEIMRRTDGFFWGNHQFPTWQRGGSKEYSMALDEAFAYPSGARLARLATLDDRQRDRLPTIWRRRWGSIDLRWLRNHQIMNGSGFCHPDGSVAFVGELEDYPTGPEVLNDLRRLSSAFPGLAMDVAVWCTAGQSMLGFPFHDGLETAWPPELLARVAEPTVGFLVKAGNVTVVRGFDRRLFAARGLRYPQALEMALHETRRLDEALVHESAFARRDHRGLRDDVLYGWIDCARALGLAR